MNLTKPIVLLAVIIGWMLLALKVALVVISFFSGVASSGWM